MALNTSVCVLHSAATFARVNKLIALVTYRIISVNIRVNRMAVRLEGNIGKYAGRERTGIATRYGLDGPVIESRWGGGRDFPHPSRPALGPTQPPIQ